MFGLASSSLSCGGEITAGGKLDVLWLFTIDWWFPARQRTLVNRRIVGEGGVRNFCNHLAVLQHPHLRIPRHSADFDRVESPLFKDAEDLIFAALLRDQQHALLRFAQHDLVGSHASLPLRNAIQFDFDAGAPARAHLAGRAGQSGRAHVLNADDGPGLHGFEAGFEQKFFEEWIADLHIRALRFRAFAELFARHGRAVNAVPPGLRSHINNRIAFAGGARIKDLVFTNQPQSKCVHQGIARVARLELHFAAKVRHAKAISIGGDAADHTFHDGMILVNLRLHRGGRRRLSSSAKPGGNRPKAQ